MMSVTGMDSSLVDPLVGQERGKSLPHRVMVMIGRFISGSTNVALSKWNALNRKEKVFWAGVFWIIRKLWPQIYKGLNWLWGVIKPKLQDEYRRLFGGDPVFKKGVGSDILESRREGSEEAPFSSPACQVLVVQVKGTETVIIGSAIRMGGIDAHDKQFLVGPEHVLVEERGVDKRMRGKNGFEVSLNNRPRIEAAFDSMGIELTSDEFSQAGVQRAVIVGVPETGVIAKIVGPEGKGTNGKLTHAGLGVLEYSGSTFKGYSGSAYSNGTKGIYGIHQRGGTVNAGISAEYVWIKLQVAVKAAVFESSEDYLMTNFRKGKAITWFNDDDDSEYVFVKNSAGKYARVTKNSMAKAFSDNWENTNGVIRIISKKAEFDDVVPESKNSGEAPSSKFPGASNVSVVPGPQVDQSLQGLMSGWSSLSVKKQKNLLKSVRACASPSSVTSTLES
nr:MAG: hypothetical protein 1 [XiangYun luteo-sobemo-like virus 1]